MNKSEHISYAILFAAVIAGLAIMLSRIKLFYDFTFGINWLCW